METPFVEKVNKLYYYQKKMINVVVKEHKI